MSNHPEVPMSEDDGYSLQEQQEHEQWLDEYEKETVANLDYNMKRMWKEFERIFNANQAQGGTNGSDSQKT